MLRDWANWIAAIASIQGMVESGELSRALHSNRQKSTRRDEVSQAADQI